jgi:hypothetical protein
MTDPLGSFKSWTYHNLLCRPKFGGGFFSKLTYCVKPRFVHFPTDARIKVVHILSRPFDGREQLSMSSVRNLASQGFHYIQKIIPPFRDIPPAQFCATPQFISEQSGILNGKVVDWTLSPGTYGCYSSQKSVITEGFDEDTDYLLVCECDCILRLSAVRFADAVRRYARLMDEKRLAVVAIGAFTDPGGDVMEGLAPCMRIVETHCMLYSRLQKEYILEKFKTVPWDNYDLWVSSAFGRDGKLAVTARRLAIQSDGNSLITHKNWFHPRNWSAFGFVKSRKLFS